MFVKAHANLVLTVVKLSLMSDRQVAITAKMGVDLILRERDLAQ
jgi:hypothetical protein